MPLVDMVVVVAEIYAWHGLPAVLNTLEHDSGNIKALWPQSIYRDVLQYIIDNVGRHDTEGLFNDLSFFSY